MNVMENDNGLRRAALKAAILVLFVLGCVYMAHFTPVGSYLNTEKLGAHLDVTNAWAPLAFMALYTVGVCLFIPATVLIALGVAVFGVSWGFVYCWLASMVGSSVSFYIGRYLGRDFASRVIGTRLQKYDDLTETCGFSTVLYLRLACLPFAPLNFGMGLTRVRFRDFFWGTALGILVVTLAITVSAGVVRDILSSGQWDRSHAWKIPFTLGLFAISLATPKVIKKWKRQEEG